jgi:DNA-binding MarR family transcriptional regulator
MLSNSELAERLRVSVGRLARRLRQQSLGGLTPSQASVLATLDNHGSMSMSLIAEHESIARPSATGIVGRLVEKGLVERSADPDDLRLAIVVITTSGETLLEDRRRERTAYLTRRIERLTGEDRVVLLRAVEILERLHEEG